jgi:hypothetical protein
VTKKIQVVRDAEEQAGAIFVRRVIAEEDGICDFESWAFRVGANAARRIAGESEAVLSGASGLEDAVASSVAGDEVSLDIRDHERRASLARVKEILTAHQFMIVSVLMRPGMTQGRAAQLLELDRRNLARTFARALARIEEARNGPSLPS